jgi:predicted DNA binding CopG/RHH family protein
MRAENTIKNILEAKMKVYKLDKEEKKLVREMNKEEWKSVKNLDEIKKELSAIAKASKDAKRKNARINIRLNEIDLNLLKIKASKAGLPYQTFIGSELHKIAHK